MDIHYNLPHGKHATKAQGPLIDCSCSPSGDFLWLPLSSEYSSQFSGYHLRALNASGWDMVKTLYDFGTIENITAIEKFPALQKTVITTSKGTIAYEQLPSGLYIANNQEIHLRLDCRYIYDYNTTGRIYDVSEKDGIIYVKYTKYVDDSKQNRAYETHLLIKGAKKYSFKRSWDEVRHNYDVKRGTQPQQWWVFNLLTLAKNQEIYVAHGITLEEAQDNLKKTEAESAQRLLADELSKENNTTINARETALACTQYAINHLTITHNNGPALYAGLPWFFQVWTRDETISLGASIAQKKWSVVKKIILRHIKSIRTDGRCANRYPHADLGTADGTGWAMYRTYQTLRQLHGENSVRDVFTSSELLSIASAVEKHLVVIGSTARKDDLIIAKKDETWMDTSYGNDIRDGACIEIQALYLASVELYELLMGHIGMKPKAEIIDGKEKTKISCKAFFDPSCGCADRIIEGNKDFTQRPNLFLAAYIYPTLFEQAQWEIIFDRALEQLWSENTGIASISKNHHLFCGTYTPQENKSYHRGDVWFWINNISGIVLKRHNKYANYTNRLQEIAITEMLKMGAIGYCAEVTAFNTLESHGCQAQMWSCATLFEFLSIK